jgi:hypothetical protein
MAASEIGAARRADLVITHSSAEAELLRREIGFGKVHVKPFAVAPVPRGVPLPEREGIAILGGYEHAPNPGGATPVGPANQLSRCPLASSRAAMEDAGCRRENATRCLVL